jgi:hypothetical protein
MNLRCALIDGGAITSVLSENPLAESLNLSENQILIDVYGDLAADQEQSAEIADARFRVWFLKEIRSERFRRLNELTGC